MSRVFFLTCCCKNAKSVKMKMQKGEKGDEKKIKNKKKRFYFYIYSCCFKLITFKYSC